MNTPNDSSPAASIPRAVADQFDAEFARVGELDRATPAPNVAAEHQVVHERESSLPVTLVPGLGERKAPLRAASGDDEVMSQPPTVTKTRGS
jgi:hypothetical protein